MKRKYCQKRSIKQFAPGVLRHKSKRIRIRRARFWRWMRIAAIDGELGRGKRKSVAGLPAQQHVANLRYGFLPIGDLIFFDEFGHAFEKPTDFLKKLRMRIFA